eukprot:TCONS_00072532-protein
MKEKCYVCGSKPAKQCTGCHLISYCCVSCQKKDWSFHKHSCKSKPHNVVDFLINANIYDDLVKKIFHYLPGRELHYVRCVKRSWRAIVDSMWHSKVDRNLFEVKLAHQWTHKHPRGRMLFQGHGMPSQEIKHNSQELFLACRDQNKILVLDMDNMYKVTYVSRWQTKTKYVINVDNTMYRDLIWDVHKSFVMVWNKTGIKCWDRITKEEMVICDESKKLQSGIGMTGRYASGGKRKDIPKKINIFGNIVIIVYLSGLILKFSVKISPVDSEDSHEKIATFHLLHNFENLVDCSPVDIDQIKISHGTMSNGQYYFGCTRIYSKLYYEGDSGNDSSDDECNEAGLWCLEDDEFLADLQEVEDIHAVSRVGDDDYCLLSRNHDSTDQHNFNGSDMNALFCPTKYLELWKNNKSLRSLKVKGLSGAYMNKICIAILCHPGLMQPTSLTCYFIKDIADPNINFSNLSTVLVTPFDSLPKSLFMTKNQIIWSHERHDKDGCFLCYKNPCSRDTFAINSMNFWYVPYYADQTVDVPPGHSLPSKN